MSVDVMGVCVCVCCPTGWMSEETYSGGWDSLKRIKMVVVNIFQKDGGTLGDIRVEEGAHRSGAI